MTENNRSQIGKYQSKNYDVVVAFVDIKRTTNYNKNEIKKIEVKDELVKGLEKKKEFFSQKKIYAKTCRKCTKQRHHE